MYRPIAKCVVSCMVYIFGTGRSLSDITTHLLLVVLLVGTTAFKKPKVPSIVSNRIGTKFGRIVLQVNAHRLTKSDFRFAVSPSYLQDGGHDVIARRKVLPPGQ